MGKNLILSLVTTMLFYIGCEDAPISEEEALLNVPGAFITNEGNFGQSNGTLSYYSVEEKTVKNEIFREVNGRGLGDVVQSMSIMGNFGFIVVNNSNTIEVVDIHSLESVATINFTNGESPRNIAFAGEKIYVTNLYAGSVAVYDIDDYRYVKSIKVGLNPDAIYFNDFKLYVANSGFGLDNTVSVIDVLTDQVIRTIRVGDYPADIKNDAEGEIHVLCSGYSDWENPENDTPGGIYIIDPANDTVVDSIILQGHPSKLALSGEGKGFFIDGFFGNIGRYSTITNELEEAEFISGSFYGLAVEQSTHRLYVLDPRFFTQDGELQIYNPQGELLESYDVGFGPGTVCFSYQ